MSLPEHGQPKDQILEALEAKRANDVRWQDGRTFGMVYDGGPELHAVQDAVASAFLHENALNTMAFPSLGQIQGEVVRAAADLCHGGDAAAGFMTSGGTESILMAVLAARERGRIERGIDRPEMVVGENAHAAFHKAAHSFGITLHKVPVRDDWRVDTDAMADCVTDSTVLVVGSAPAYPQGVIDDIETIAAIGADAGANVHTDACMGGFILPFAEQLGHDVPPWDFRVPGVTSISADIHKLGYAPKGASVILHRSKELRRYQTFVFDQWLGGFYASPNMQGARGRACRWRWPGRRCGTWASTATSTSPTSPCAAAQCAPGCAPSTASTCSATRSSTCWPSPPTRRHPAGAAGVDIFAVGDAMAARGWFHDRQAPPDSLHATVSAGNAPVMNAYLVDLADVVAEAQATAAAVDDRSTNYATLE
ncbi:MAG: aminotransferase class V-fold PLP-dependent enzyme [Acidimicrobiales bacterium]